MSYSQDISFTVKQHNPRRRRITQILLVMVALILMYGIYELGRWQAGYVIFNTNKRIDDLKATIKELSDEKQMLIEKNVGLDSAVDIERQVAKDIRDRLEEVNNEVLELKDELAFYRSLLNPAQQKPGLHLQQFEVKTDRFSGNFQYRIVLTQMRGEDRFVSGHINFEIKGYQGETVKTLVMNEVVAEKADKLKFRFKYFQQIEGLMVLPDDFQPSDVLVRVKPSSNRLDSIEQAYQWSAINAGG